MEILQADVLHLTDGHLVDEIILRKYIDAAVDKAVGEVQQLRADLQQAVGDMAGAATPLLEQMTAQAEALEQVRKQVADLTERLDAQAKELGAQVADVAEAGRAATTAAGTQAAVIEQNRDALAILAKQVDAVAAQQPEFEKSADQLRELILRYQLEFNRVMKQKADGALVFAEAAVIKE